MGKSRTSHIMRMMSERKRYKLGQKLFRIQLIIPVIAITGIVVKSAKMGEKQNFLLIMQTVQVE